MGLLITMDYGNYTNKNAVENVIRYASRTRANEDRFSELVSFGGMGVTMLSGVEDIIAQFLYVQNVYNIETRQGKRIYHEVFSLDEREAFNIKYDMTILDAVAKECCKVYYSAGFQVVYAIHYDPGKKYHIHFIVNSINYRTGLKWHTNFRSNHERWKIFQTTLIRAMCIECPIELTGKQPVYFI